MIVEGVSILLGLSAFIMIVLGYWPAAIPLVVLALLWHWVTYNPLDHAR